MKAICSLFISIFILIGCDSKSEFEKNLNKTQNWPVKLEGDLYFLEVYADDSSIYPFGALATFEPSGTDEVILLEFKAAALKNAKLSDDVEIFNPVTVNIYPAINEYYQVESLILSHQ